MTLTFDGSQGEGGGQILRTVLALARGESLFRTEELTSHLATNIAVVEQLLPVRFHCLPGTGEVRVAGAGFKPS